MRKGISIEVTPADRGRLQSIVGDRSSPQKHVRRARIVPLSGDGIGTMAIMRAVGKGKYRGIALAAALYGGRGGGVLHPRQDAALTHRAAACRNGRSGD